MSENDTQMPEQPWPNQLDVVDGVVPAADVPQDPDLYDGDEDLDAVMEEEA